MPQVATTYEISLLACPLAVPTTPHPTTTTQANWILTPFSSLLIHVCSFCSPDLQLSPLGRVQLGSTGTFPTNRRLSFVCSSLLVFFICSCSISLTVQPLVAFILLLFLIAGWHRVELMKMHEHKCWRSGSFTLSFWAETGASRYHRSYHCAVHTRTTDRLLFSWLHRERKKKSLSWMCSKEAEMAVSLFSWLLLPHFARPQGRGGLLTRNHFHYDTHRSSDNCYYEAAPPTLEFSVFPDPVFFFLSTFCSCISVF